MSEPAQGACLCGKVQLALAASKTQAGACHCSMCRTWSGGGPFLAIHAVPDVEITGGEHITCFQSSPWAERGFCSHCGTNLFYRMKHNGDHMLAAGLFTEAELSMGREIFVDQKADWYGFLSEESVKKTKAEVMGG